MTHLDLSRLLRPTTARAQLTWRAAGIAALGDTRRLQHLTEDLLLLARLDLDKPGEQHRMDPRPRTLHPSRHRPHPPHRRHRSRPRHFTAAL
ncbi:hypothetical protein ACFH04_03800 [Streptomyces noboritoensis]|uniref:Uncharacterized protein n=1 Tax=Streptomyces noboritoensis TaxID=67337 RepID=A0ABV6TCE7_9ACTN